MSVTLNYYYSLPGGKDVEHIEVDPTERFLNIRRELFKRHRKELSPNDVERDLVLYATKCLQMDPSRTVDERARTYIEDLQPTRLVSLVYDELGESVANGDLVHFVLLLKSQLPQASVQRNDSLSLELSDPGDWDPFDSGWSMETDKTWIAFLAYWRKKAFPREERILPLAFDDRGKDDPKFRLDALARSGSRIFVLEYYYRLAHRVMALLEEGVQAGILLTGQPGTGKTTWLWFMLVYLLTMKKDVILHANSKTRFFHGDHIYVVTSSEVKYPLVASRSERIPCLIDSDLGDTPPPTYLTSENVPGLFPIHASSPNPKRYRLWFKTRGGVVFGMPLWSKEDILKGFELHDVYNWLVSNSQKPPPTVELSTVAVEICRAARESSSQDSETATKVALAEMVNEAIEKYGEAPRDVYTAIVNSDQFELDIEGALEKLSYDELAKALRQITSSNTIASDTPATHKLVALSLRPGDVNGYAKPDKFVPKFKSEYLGRKMVEKIGHLTFEQAHHLYNVYRWHPESSSLAGWIFEGLAHGCLCGLSNDIWLSGPLIPMSKTQSKDDNKRIIYHFSTPMPLTRGDSALADIIRPRVYVRVSFLGGKLKWPPEANFVTPLEQCFCVPSAFNNPLFDSFFVQLEEDRNSRTVEPIVWIFQTTISDRHGGSQAGYALVRSIARLALECAKTFVEKQSEDESEGTPRKKRKLPGKSPVGVGIRVVPTKIKYVLVCPLSKNQVKHVWDMPEAGRKGVNGSVFCQFIDDSGLPISEDTSS